MSNIYEYKRQLAAVRASLISAEFRIEELTKVVNKERDRADKAQSCCAALEIECAQLLDSLRRMTEGWNNNTARDDGLYEEAKSFGFFRNDEQARRFK